MALSLWLKGGKAKAFAADFADERRSKARVFSRPWLRVRLMSLRFAALRPAAARNGGSFQLTRHLSSLALLVSDRAGLLSAAPCGAVRS